MLIYTAMLDTPEQESLFLALYNDNRKTMLYKAESILHNNGWAEDAVHDAFVKISKNIEVFRQMSCNERRYLCVTIVKNIALNILRDSHQENAIPYEDTGITADYTEVSDEMISMESVHELTKLIEALPQKLKDVVQLRLVLQLSTKETAALLNISEEDVRTSLHRGRKQLISSLSREGKI